MKKKIYLLLLFAFLCNVTIIIAQNEDSSFFKTKVSADFVSNYVWRGVYCYSPLGNQMVLAPGFQPTIGLIMGNFEIGSWGATDFTGAYKEVDLYATYSLKGFSATIYDYYWDLAWQGKNYFDYDEDKTSHIIEATLAYKSTKIPFSVSVNTFVYGADKKYDKKTATFTTDNNYSTYIELGYSFKVNNSDIDAFIGATPADGYYGDGYGSVDGFAVVNVGATGYKTVKFSEHLETKLKTSLIFNPQQEKSYLVLGLSF